VKSVCIMSVASTKDTSLLSLRPECIITSRVNFIFQYYIVLVLAFFKVDSVSVIRQYQFHQTVSVSSDSISVIRQYQCHQTISVSSDSNSIIRYLEIHFYFGVECVCVWKQYSSWLQISMTSDLITSCVLRYILLPKLRHILRIQVYKECPKFHRNYKMGSL